MNASEAGGRAVGSGGRPTLSRRDERWLRAQGWQVPAALLLGVILLSAGGGYGIWAARRLRTASSADEATAFDRPVARLVGILAADDEARLRALNPTTDLERSLVAELRRKNDLLARLMLALLRVLMATLVLGAGGMLLASGLSKLALLRIVRALRAGEGPPT